MQNLQFNFKFLNPQDEGMSPMRSIVRMAMQQLVSLNAEEWAG